MNSAVQASPAVIAGPVPPSLDRRVTAGFRPRLPANRQHDDLLIRAALHNPYSHDAIKEIANNEPNTTRLHKMKMKPNTTLRTESKPQRHPGLP
jgi:hypothetical protein